MARRKTPSDPQLPEPSETVHIGAGPHVVEVCTYYHGKTGGYSVDRTWVLCLVDRTGRRHEGRWEQDWSEIAAGLETRGESALETSKVGQRRSEIATTASIRIHPHACPVHVQLRKAHEYNDYDDDSFSSRSVSDIWIRYEP